MVFATGIVFSSPVNWRCWEAQQQNIPVKITLFYNRFEVTASPIIHPHHLPSCQVFPLIRWIPPCQKSF